jgi:hypothetical protein
VGHQGSNTPHSPVELRRAIALERSYLGPAAIVFLLYWLWWIPGFIFNILWRLEAEETRRLTGTAPSGIGCLTIMFIVGLLPLAFYGLLTLTLLGATVAGAALLGGAASNNPRSPVPAPFGMVSVTPRPINARASSRRSFGAGVPQPARPVPQSTASSPSSPFATKSSGHSGPPPVVSRKADLRTGVAYRLTADNQLSTDRGDITIRAGNWVRIDSSSRRSYGLLARVEVAAPNGNRIGRGYMTFRF